jgi:molecular chaperone HscB
VDFKQDYFEIFQFPRGFDIDQALLSERFRELQKSVHPDKYVGASDAEKRLSMQWTVQINTAHDTLKASLARAIYLLELSDVKIETNPNLDPVFLMEQIELREELEEIGEADDAISQLDDFKHRVKQVMASLESSFSALYNANELEAAEQEVYKLQFLNKLWNAADHLEEKLLDY